jgi:hypothetical protein
MRIIVDDGKMEVICRDKEQALEYIEQLKLRGHTNFILMETRDEDKSTGQVREDLQEPIERYEDRTDVGL